MFNHFFKPQTYWWGKLLGGFLGYLMAGPIGLLLGVLMGNFFDRGLNAHLNTPLWHYQTQRRLWTELAFLNALFATMGHIAKADGRVSEDEIQMAKNTMQQMKLNRTECQKAQVFFNEGKKETFPLESTLTSLYNQYEAYPNLLKLFIDIQYAMAQIDGLSEKKQQLINTVLAYLHRAPLHEQSRFYDDVYQHFKYNAHGSHQRSSHTNHQHRERPQANHALQNAYSVLNVPPTATHSEVKRAYRKLISKHHPDKLIAKKMSASQIKQANETTQLIRKAYETICAEKGYRA